MLRVSAEAMKAKRKEVGCSIFEAYAMVKREIMKEEIDQLYRCIDMWGMDREHGLRMLRLIELMMEKGPRG